jgi:hypothetical protein
MRRFLALLLLLFPLPVLASHAWSEVDICKLYEDKLPPGLTAESLPGATSQGAGLLARYCNQCHNLPGPDRHTATAWHVVTSKMFMLMEVSSRFGGVRGRVETPLPEEQAILRDYLQRHAADTETAPDATAPGAGSWLPRALALLPVLLLTGLGALRWWLAARSERRRCVTG